MKTIFTRVPYFCTYYYTILRHSKVSGSSVPPTSFSYTRSSIITDYCSKYS